MKQKGNNMRKISFVRLVLILILFMNVPKSDAAEWPVGTTGFFVQACTQNDGTLAGYCRGMIIGISAILSANSELNPRPPFHACVRDANTSTIIQGFILWAKKNSSNLNEEATIGFTRYLNGAFPC